MKKQNQIIIAMTDIFFHPSAIIDEGAIIGPGCKIWHFTHIMSGAEIGADCNIGQNVMIATGVKLGHNVKIQNNVSIYAGVVCEDNVFLGPSCVFTNIKNPRSEISRRDQYISTIVRQGATIGANATIVCGIEIGKYALVGAGAVVTKSIPDYAIVMGVPARITGWISRHGYKLEFDKDGIAVCKESGTKYKIYGNHVHAIE